MIFFKDNYLFKHTKHLIIGLLCVFSFSLKSQCFQIESILVDGCDGSDEGKNEMVIFKVGSTALDANNLNVTWATTTNPWLGICQSATTVQKIAQINATIFGCGYLKEPVNGILPANSRVLLITSTAFNPLAHSFANLSDTLIVIFQCAGNTGGHFGNFGTGTKTLSMSFSPPSGCSDAVSYNKALLTMQNGSVGAEDGATVLFTPSGTATYVNYGCQAPYTPLSVDAGANKTICNNSSQSFSATITGNYTSLQWSLSPNTSGTLSSTNSLNTTYTPGVSDNGTIKLYCTLTKSCSAQSIAIKDSVTLTIIQIPQPVISVTTNTLCTGQSAVLSFSVQNAASTGTTSFVWQPGNITTPTISVNSTNNYSIAVTNTCGTNIDSYSVTSFPTPTVNITASGSTQLCAGGSVILTAQSNTNNYLWTGGATTQSVHVNSTATLVVTSTNVCGSAQASQTININPNSLTVSITATNVSCFGGNNGSVETIVTGGTLPYTYNWQPSVTTSNSISNVPTGTYSVTVNDANNCVQNQTITISQPAILNSVISNTAATCAGNNGAASVTVTGGTSPYSYTWTPTNAQTPTVQNLANGSYTVLITDNNNCTITATTSLANPNAVSATINTTSVSCFNGNNGTAQAVVTGGQAPYSYVWQSLTVSSPSVSNLAAGNYTVLITDNNSCQTTKSFIITQAPQLTVVANGTTACNNRTVTISALASGGTGTYTYVWDNGAFTGQHYTINSGVTKTYSVVVSDQNNCTANDTAIVTTANDISIDFTSDIDSGCPTLCVNYRELTPNATINTWDWDFGDGNHSQFPTTINCYTNSGNYNVSLTVTNNQGCTKTISKQNFIYVAPKPQADYTPSKYEAEVGDADIAFTNLSSLATNWTWNFGDGTMSTDTNSHHSFDKEGTYLVTLNVLSKDNCRDSITKEIIIRTDFTFYIPNSFSPNGDFINDEFLPVGTNWDTTHYELRIFSRWGNEIFKTTDTQKGWDGKLKNGEYAESNVYVWKVDMKDIFKEKHHYIGHVTLLK